MIKENRKWLVIGGMIGLLVGLVVSIPAHYENPFLTAPGVFLAILVSGIGSLITGSLFLFNKRSPILIGVCAVFVAMLAVLILVPLAWPYPGLEDPKPLTRRVQKDGRKKTSWENRFLASFEKR
jgi:hypothetical protein